ncbi:MAG TPA: hypothetical protein VFV40_05865 [Nocardioides sp.]|nr:hypothetical protein [Nocardioides sp.]
MTDPLLTIEDAIREFRVSPKTVRRRLVAGEIDGAYKRPGSRGPEWVMPLSSLEAVGFARRAEVPVAALPPDEADRAAYWERRALDAEAALQTFPGAAASTPAAPAVPVGLSGGRRWVVFAVALLVVGGVLGALVAAVVDRGDGGATTTDEVASARAVLGALTEPGDEIGIVGRVPQAALPPSRTAVPAPAGDADGPRYVVAALASADASEVGDLRRRSAVVLDLPRSEGSLLVLDTQGEAETPPAEAPSSTLAPTSSSPTISEPPPTADGPDHAGASGGTPTTEPAPTALQADSMTAGTPRTDVIVVDAGDSFWSIATELAAPTGADVTSVWLDLIDRNRDRLVEPGDPDLLHVGQVLAPPGPG